MPKTRPGRVRSEPPLPQGSWMGVDLGTYLNGVELLVTVTGRFSNSRPLSSLESALEARRDRLSPPIVLNFDYAAFETQVAANVAGSAERGWLRGWLP
jgi:hypothetical protein